MPHVEVKNEKTITYSSKELGDLIVKDLQSKGLAWPHTFVSNIEDTQVKTGEIPRGQFDSDPIYSFSGIKIVIQEGND